jgi:DNA-binding LytR/AlgR family response regulator
MVSMKNVELILPASLFIRIHKSFIISIDRLIEFDSQSVTLNAHVLPIGTQYKAELRKKLLIAEKILPVSKKSTKLPVAGMT